MNWTNAEVVSLYFWGMIWGILIGNPFWRIVRSLSKPSEVKSQILQDRSKNPNKEI